MNLKKKLQGVVWDYSAHATQNSHLCLWILIKVFNVCDDELSYTLSFSEWGVCDYFGGDMKERGTKAIPYVFYWQIVHTNLKYKWCLVWNVGRLIVEKPIINETLKDGLVRVR
jgi:hypothetical protein